MIFTARKRSLEQGNVLTPVCQSFRSRGGGGVMMSLPIMDSIPPTAHTPCTAPIHPSQTPGQHSPPSTSTTPQATSGR